MNAVRARPNSVAVAIVAILLALGLSDPVWVDAAVIIGIHALIALSVGLSFGQAGLLSLAQAPFAAIGAYATGILTVKLGWSPLTGLGCAVVLPTAIGYLLARLVIRLEPLAVALATLALAAILEVWTRNWDAVTGGYMGLTGIPTLQWADEPRRYLWLVLFSICAIVFVYENLMVSRFGRALNTIRHDRARAMADGVPVAALSSAAFGLSASFAGVAGWLYAHYVSYVGPGDLGTHLSISVVLMAVIGGASYVLGPLVGAVVLGVLMRLLPAQELQGLFYGFTLIVILLVARDGVLGLVAPRLLRMRGKFRSEPAVERPQSTDVPADAAVAVVAAVGTTATPESGCAR